MLVAIGHRSRRQNEAATVTVAAKFSVQLGGNARGIVSLSPDIYTSAPRFLFQAADSTIAWHSAVQ
jgi:hypothetical protein